MGITREEQLLKSVATGVASDIKPITREEQYLSYIGGGSSVLPAQPITRKEVLLDTIAKNGIGSGGGGGVTINNQDKTITENGTYTADSGYTGLGTVTVSVASPPSDIDGLLDGSIEEITSGVTRIRKYCLAYSYVSKINFPNVTEIGEQAFLNSQITEANFPLVTKLGHSAFKSCAYIVEANLPLLTTVAHDIFYECYKLAKVICPNFTSLPSQIFRSCYRLPSLDFHKLTSIDTRVFYNCYSLTRLILRHNEGCTLSNSNSFDNCYHFHGTVNAAYNPEGLKDGYIYVPRALIEDYKVATNWSNFATQFRALEDYTVDGTITGALDENKI